MAALALLAAAAAAPTASGGCAYTPHPGTTYLGPDNVIECKNAEGLAGCRARCTAELPRFGRLVQRQPSLLFDGLWRLWRDEVLAQRVLLRLEALRDLTHLEFRAQALLLLGRAIPLRATEAKASTALSPAA